MEHPTEGVKKLLQRQFHVEILEDDIMVGLVSIDLCHAVWDGNGIWIARMYTPPKHRRKGLCRVGMNKLMEAADELGVNLYSGPSAYGEMTTAAIVDWRQRQGFAWWENQGTKVLRRLPKPRAA